MSFEHAKMIITGGYASSVYFDVIRELTGKEDPVIAFDTSPRVTQENYNSTRKAFTDAFVRLKLPEPIWLQDDVSQPLTPNSLARGLEKADALLVTGGATKHAYEKWQAAGITHHIIERVINGDIVAAGGSAGAMIWFSQGYSDSMMYEVAEGSDWNYIVTPGVGLFRSWVTAHHTDTDTLGKNRREGFIAVLEENSGQWEQAIGLDTGAALVCSKGIACVKDITLPSNPADHNVYVYGSDLAAPVILAEGDSLSLACL